MPGADMFGELGTKRIAKNTTKRSSSDGSSCDTQVGKKLSVPMSIEQLLDKCKEARATFPEDHPHIKKIDEQICEIKKQMKS